MNHNHTLLAVLLLLSGPLDAIEADESILLGDRQLRVTLDAERHFALRCVEVDGTQFASGGEFPCFHLFDAEGREHRCPADEAGWNATATRTPDGLSVAYARPGFQADVTYAVGPDEVRITIVPRHESTLKIRAISGGGGLLGILRSRIEILKYIQSKGIHISSEGLQEGLSEYCGFAWDAQTRPGWTSEFAAGEPVPLVPVLFQGMTYYYVTWHPAWNLLCGGKAGYEADSLNRDGVKNTYFGNIVFWAKIADRTVRNMIRTERGWRVEYTEGGSLSVDLADMTPAMSFVLEIDGHRYTAENPPPSPRGVPARWIRQGEYELQYPPNWKQP